MNYEEIHRLSDHPKDKRDLMDEAGKMVGLNLKEPIDCSQMQVYSVTSDVETSHDVYNFGNMHMLRKAQLFAFVINEQGEREELTIEFTLKSYRRPKI